MSTKTNLFCPTCGRYTRKDGNLICSNCFNVFKEDSGIALANEIILALTEWTIEAMKHFLETVLRPQLKERQDLYNATSEKVTKDAYEAIRKNAGGNYIQKDIFTIALAEKRKQLWDEANGNRVYAQLKTAGTNVLFVRNLITQLEARKPNKEFVPAAVA